LKPILAAVATLVALYVFVIAALAFNQRSFIYHPQPEVVAPDYLGIQAVQIRTEDGETLNAWWLAPPQAEAGQGPVFLFFDGNMGRPQRWRERWEAIAAGNAGFLAIAYRGYAGSTGHPTEEGLYADARAAYDWLIAQGYGPHDIVIHGLSLGSGVATFLASERPARVLILEAPFTSVVDVVREDLPFVPEFVVTERFMSRERIARVNMPVLIAHGDADSTIPFAHGQRLYALAREPKVFVGFPGGEHVTLVQDGLYEHIWPFLAAHPAHEQADTVPAP
jgi:hypothetical protein